MSKRTDKCPQGKSDSDSTRLKIKVLENIALIGSTTLSIQKIQLNNIQSLHISLAHILIRHHRFSLHCYCAGYDLCKRFGSLWHDVVFVGLWSVFVGLWTHEVLVRYILSKYTIKSILWIISYAIYGAVCFQLTHFSFDMGIYIIVIINQKYEPLANV